MIALAEARVSSLPLTELISVSSEAISDKSATANDTLLFNNVEMDVNPVPPFAAVNVYSNGSDKYFIF